MNLKRGAWTEEQFSKKVVPLIQATEYHVLTADEYTQLVDWIYKAYDVTYLSKFFYTKLNQIISGTYKSLRKNVPACDLLDMWQQKKSSLDKIAISKKIKGSEIIGEQRIHYDLAILLSKYDSYLNWKKTQDVIKEEIIKQSNESNVEYQHLNITSNDENTINIADILDEI